MVTDEAGTRMVPEASSPTMSESLLPFERLLSKVSADLVLASPATVQHGIHEGLRRLAEFFDVDRSVLYEHSPDRRGLLERASYTRPGIPTNPADARSDSHLPWSSERMLRGEIVRFDSPAELPPEAVREWAQAGLSGLQSYLAVPVLLQGGHHHHLVLASFRRKRAWTDDAVPRLLLLGEMLAGAFERARIEQELRESEQRYREVFELTSDCIFLLDVTPDMRFIVARFNPAEERTVGLSACEGRPLEELLPEEVACKVAANFRRCVEAGHRISYEEAIALPVGLRYFHTTLIPVKDAAGRIHRIVGIAHHITERVEAEQATHLLADASRALAESLDYPTTLARITRIAVPLLADWCVVDILENGELRRLAGAHVEPSKEALLQLLAERYPVTGNSQQPAGRVLRTQQAILCTHATDDMLWKYTHDADHMNLIRALGCHSFMSLPLVVRDRVLGTVTFVSCRPGRHYGAVDLSRAQDLASRMALAIDNARLYREAQESIRMRDDFLSIASHELRTPITSLGLAVQSLLGPRREPTREDLLRVLRLVRQQSRRLTRLVEEILTFSRIQGGHMELHRERLDLVSEVREIIELLEVELARAGCAVELDAAAPVIGRWDAVKLDEVVTNLLTNALKFGARRPVTIALEAVEGTARMSVTDRGIGIAPDRIPHIFERFERAVSSSHYGGLGLGLYIVRELVEAHGGSVRAESRVGAGSSFIVELPLEPPEPTR